MTGYRGGMPTALLVIDMLNTYEHEDAEQLMDSVRDALPALRRIVERARDADVATIYVNDNHGDWASGRSELTQAALRGASPDLVEPVTPPEGSILLTKARHSAFYETQLEYLLHEQGIDRVVLTGQVTEQCILYSALDAYVRKFAVVIPEDAVAGIRPDLARAALEMMELNMHADVLRADDVDLVGEGAGDGPADGVSPAGSDRALS
jgi:nicotinamidase-related amidase